MLGNAVSTPRPRGCSETAIGPVFVWDVDPAPAGKRE